MQNSMRNKNTAKWKFVLKYFMALKFLSKFLSFVFVISWLERIEKRFLKSKNKGYVTIQNEYFV